MVAFCAMYTIQSISQSSSAQLSDWTLFRIATIQELVHELEKQAAARHRIPDPDLMSVVDAMARQLERGIQLVLRKQQSLQPSVTTTVYTTQGPSVPSNGLNGTLVVPQPPPLDELSEYMLRSDPMPFIPEWDLESLLPSMAFATNQFPDQASTDVNLFPFG